MTSHRNLGAFTVIRFLLSGHGTVLWRASKPTLLLRPNPKTLVCLHFRAKSGDITVFIYRLASGDTAASLHLSPETLQLPTVERSLEIMKPLFSQRSPETLIPIFGAKFMHPTVTRAKSGTFQYPATVQSFDITLKMGEHNVSTTLAH
jgi:hypothetical protein